MQWLFLNMKKKGKISSVVPLKQLPDMTSVSMFLLTCRHIGEWSCQYQT